jgi:hypothetical protein
LTALGEVLENWNPVKKVNINLYDTMNSIKIVAQLRKHGESQTVERTAYMVLSDHDDTELFIQMAWGSWYDIISYQSEDIEIHVSKNYIKEQSLDLIRRA